MPVDTEDQLDGGVSGTVDFGSPSPSYLIGSKPYVGLVEIVGCKVGGRLGRAFPRESECGYDLAQGRQVGAGRCLL